MKRETSQSKLPKVTIPQPPSIQKQQLYYYNFDQEPKKDSKYNPYLDQLALNGHEKQVLLEEPNSPSANSLFYLGPSGPSMPVFGKMRSDLSQMMNYLMRGPVKDMAQTLTKSPVPMMSRVGSALHKLMGGMLLYPHSEIEPLAIPPFPPVSLTFSGLKGWASMSKSLGGVYKPRGQNFGQF